MNLSVHAAAAIHAANLQPGQVVYLRGQTAHHQHALMIAELARAHGASDVIIDLLDPHEEAHIVQYGTPFEVETYFDYQRENWKRVIREGGVTIALVGAEAPDLRGELQAEHPDRYGILMAAEEASRALYKTHVVGRNASQWCLVPSATPGWAKKIFPDLSPEEAMMALSGALDRVMFATGSVEECIAQWEEMDLTLHKKRDWINGLGIKEVHVTGPGSDFRIGFSEIARFEGGSKTTSTTGIRYNANRPSFELFTTPDWRTAQGTLAMSMGFMCAGVEVRDLVLYFQDGRIFNSDASKGLEAFKAKISHDAGARQIGEFALVDRSTPIGQEGVVFLNTLLDENAANHIAVGSAYPSCLEGGTAMTDAQKAQVGCNMSAIHMDMMWGGPGVRVLATTFTGQEVLLMEDGLWAS